MCVRRFLVKEKLTMPFSGMKKALCSPTSVNEKAKSPWVRFKTPTIFPPFHHSLEKYQVYTLMQFWVYSTRRQMSPKANEPLLTTKPFVLPQSNSLVYVYFLLWQIDGFFKKALKLNQISPRPRSSLVELHVKLGKR